MSSPGYRAGDRARELDVILSKSSSEEERELVVERSSSASKDDECDLNDFFDACDSLENKPGRGIILDWWSGGMLIGRATARTG